MAFSNVRKFMNPQQYGTTGRVMQTERALGFNPMTESITPAQMATPLPKTPTESMMFPSEHFVTGGPGDPNAGQVAGMPNSVQSGALSAETARGIENAAIAISMGLVPGGLLAGTVADIAFNKGNPKGPLGNLAMDSINALPGTEPEGFDSVLQAQEFSLDTTPVTNSQAGLPAGFVADDAPSTMGHGQVGPLGGGLTGYGPSGPGPAGDIGLAGISVGSPNGDGGGYDPGPNW